MKHHIIFRCFFLILFPLLFCGFTQADDSITISSFVPSSVPFSKDLMSNFVLPNGFHIEVFAQDLGHPRWLACGNDGWIYVTLPDQGQVVALLDTGAGPEADTRKISTKGLPGVHGIAFLGDTVYLATPRTLWIGSYRNGDITNLHAILDSLPQGGRHPLRTVGVGPDGLLYLSVGSSCNACIEDNPWYATILSLNPNGSNPAVFARGLRNTMGFAWHPQTQKMWGMDEGTDYRGNNFPPEELNLLQQQKDYGWPFVLGNRVIDPILKLPPDIKVSPEKYLSSTTPPKLTYQAHCSPIGFAFYGAKQFPSRYKNGAFVAFHGSWNRIPAVGYKITFISFKQGEPVKFEDFLTGFLIKKGKARFGRPTSIAIDRDGSLFLSDDSNGIIYLITYRVE